MASGEPDLSVVAAAFADTRRMRILLALADGRELPAGRLAQEAGVAPSTASNHLNHLLAYGLVSVEQHGRHRYYRLSTPHVEGVLEALALIAPRRPITSLRESTRAHALRTGRTCYGHLAGQLGVRLFGEFITRGWITGGDGRYHPEQGIERPAAPGMAEVYRLSEAGAAALADWGLPARLLHPGAPLRHCVDWTEQAHHLAGPHGTALAEYLFARGWLARTKTPRAVVVTPSGKRALDNLTPGSGVVQPAEPAAAAGRAR
jgi:DNA-binding transcriptional ArsR family regulator